MPLRIEQISKQQEQYYKSLFDKHGVGVDAVASGNQVYKDLRYKKLSELFGDDQDFSAHDVGMGLGHFYEYLKREFAGRHIVYSGSDVVEEFCSHCRIQYPESKFYLRDIGSLQLTEKYDYVVFGGTFYHQNESCRFDWERFMFQLLEKAFSMARKGIVFNVISQYCDYYEKGLYYCNTLKLLDFVSDKLSRFFVMDHSYPLYEATVRVYKKDIIHQQFSETEFEKYFR